MKLPTTRMVVTIHSPIPDLNRVYEGEVPLADQQQYNLAGLVGNGKAEVTVTKDMSAKDFGQGGGVYVSVKLTCDQADQYVDYAARTAGAIASKHLVEQYTEHVRMLQNQGLIR